MIIIGTKWAIVSIYEARQKLFSFAIKYKKVLCLYNVNVYRFGYLA